MMTRRRWTACAQVVVGSRAFRWLSALLVWFSLVWFSAVGQAGGAVIYSNFGPGMAFGTSSWTINGFLGPDAGQQAIAQRFTSAATDTFTSAQVALILYSGPRSVTVFLQADSNGLPGPVLEQIDVTGTTDSPTIFTATSVLRPQLLGGIPYWLTVVAGGPEVVAGWIWNSMVIRAEGGRLSIRPLMSKGQPRRDGG